MISRVAAQLAEEVEGTIPDNPDLLAEVTNLVERPMPLRGRFEEEFLALPDDVLVAVMRKHQRYFPVYDKDGRLLPYFIAVRNGDEEHLDKVIEGNEQVIRARFSDAQFFYDNDRKRQLADFLPGLDRLTFQVDLGSMLDKVKRLQQLAPAIGQMLHLSETDIKTTTRAAALSKADLASSMVVEMTSLQGIMGGLYATASGEEAGVAMAIAEQYEAVSSSRPGLALALADRIDSLVGLFAAGLAPKGSNDPFALRRAALNIIENLITNQEVCDLRVALSQASQLLPIPADGTIVEAVLTFINGRLEGVLREEGYSASVTKAVLAELGHNPYQAHETATALSQAIEAEDWPQLLDSYARCVRITRKLEETYPLQPAHFALDEEKQLYDAYETASATQDGTIATFVASLRQMEPAITQFFDAVLVMDEDFAKRHNRLALLQGIARLTVGLADLSQLEGF